MGYVEETELEQIAHDYARKETTPNKPGERPYHAYDGCAGCLDVAAIRRVAFKAGWRAALNAHECLHDRDTHTRCPECEREVEKGNG